MSWVATQPQQKKIDLAGVFVHDRRGSPRAQANFPAIVSRFAIASRIPPLMLETWEWFASG